MVLSSSVWCQVSDTERKKHFNLTEGVALQGYDPVCYFTEFKARKGDSKFATTYKGVIYHFISESNRAKFIDNPAKYEPQYGGWCAFAMGDSGKKVDVDPETFKIINGKLYLFYNAFFNNTLLSWNEDEVNLMKRADINWKNQIK